MSKPNLRVWLDRYAAREWLVQVKYWWLPIWWTIGAYHSVEAARQAIKELEKTE